MNRQRHHMYELPEELPFGFGLIMWEVLTSQQRIFAVRVVRCWHSLTDRPWGCPSMGTPMWTWLWVSLLRGGWS